MSFSLVQAQELVVFSNIPGRTPSNKYSCRVKLVGNNTWQNAFVLQSISKQFIQAPDGSNQSGYTNTTFNWTASWITFEFSGGSVEVEIAKVDGTPITKAMVRPVGSASPALIVNGKAYLTFNNPANIDVDIDGQMEDRYTGMGYTGPAVHTICIFGNPVFKKPSLTNSRVFKLNPGDNIPPSNSTSWDTLVFNPGIHYIPKPYYISSNKVLYISGNAVVHGSIHPPNAWGNSAASNWSVYGSGTLSGEEIARDKTNIGTKPFTNQASAVKLEGFVVVDPAFHTFNMNNTTTDTTKVNIYKNLKVLGWRVNGDGINAFRNSTITDCFFRCQDDHFYYGGENVKISNCVSWADFNGAVLYVTKGGSPNGGSYFRDIKVIYHRAGWHYWEGGRVISFREREPGNVIKNVEIKNVLIEDPFPAFPPFYMKMQNPNNSNQLFDYDSILIENVVQNAVAVTSIKDATRGRTRNTILGLDSVRKFKNITFKNCSYNNIRLASFSHGDFLTNEFNENIKFVLDNYAPTIFSSITNGSWHNGSTWNQNGNIPTYGTEVTINNTHSVNVDTFNAFVDALTVNAGGTLNVVSNKTITAPSTLLYGVRNNGKIIINNSTVFQGFNAVSWLGNGELEFVGNNTVTFSANIPFSNKLTLNGNFISQANINTPSIHFKGNAKFDMGGKLINITNPSTSAITGFSVNNYFYNGTLKRAVNAIDTYEFPIGSSSTFQLISVGMNNVIGINSLSTKYNEGSITGTMPNISYNGKVYLNALNAGWFSINSDNQPISGSYNITVGLRESTNMVGDTSRYSIIRRDNQISEWQALNSSITINNTNALVTATTNNLTYLNDFAIGISHLTLSTTLNYFLANSENSKINLLWSTSNEINNKGFYVQHSVNGLNYNNIGFVPSKANSLPSNNYSFSHSIIAKGKNYYRLKQIDFNGSSFYSRILMVVTNLKPLQVYPNPAKNEIHFNFNFSSNSFITIKSILGKIVLKTKFQGNILNTSLLIPGCYYVSLVDSKTKSEFNTTFIKL